ncbi:MAG: hypothetical protein ACKO55_01860, partial [Bacteroidota bacterium]
MSATMDYRRKDEAYYTNTRRIAISLIIIMLCLYTRSAQAQSMPVGTPYWEDALRRSQLMGELDSNISFMIRPVDPNLLAGATGVWGYDSVTDP